MEDGSQPVDGELFCPNFYELIFADNGAPVKSLPALMDDFERGFISWALEKCGGNQGKAASLLKIPRTTLQSKLYTHSFEKCSICGLFKTNCVGRTGKRLYCEKCSLEMDESRKSVSQ